MAYGVTRRNVLSASGIVAAIGLPAFARAADGGSPRDSYALFNVKEPPYAAKANGIDCDRDAIQKAINDATSTAGGIVYFPPGGYFLKTGGLVVNGWAAIVGAGHSNNPSSSRNWPGRQGSWLVVDKDSKQMRDSPALTLDGDSVEVRDLGFMYDHSVDNIGSDTDVIKYPWAIDCHGSGTRIFNVFLMRAYRGILLRGGQGYIKGVYGRPVRTGIMVLNAADTGRIETIHFWSFGGTGSDRWNSYLRRHSVGIHILRADNWSFHDIFVQRSLAAIWCGRRDDQDEVERQLCDDPKSAPEVITIRRAKISNLEVDSSKHAVVVLRADGTSLQLSNIQVSGYGPEAAFSDSEGGKDLIMIAADRALVQLTNAAMIDAGANCISVRGGDASGRGRTRVIVSNAYFQDWGKSKNGAPALSVTAPAELTVDRGTCTFVRGNATDESATAGVRFV